MKRLALLTFFAISVIAIAAQSSTQMSTLFHGGEISTYYGANALKEAYAAAADGDIITLSSGTFSSTNLDSKKVTLRGAGMEDGPNRTMISGSFKLKALPTEANADIPMCIEGIYFHDRVSLSSIFDLSMIKCSFNEIWTDTYSTLRNCTFLHCMFNKGDFSFADADITFKNCYFEKSNLVGNSGTTYNLEHCTFNFSEENYNLNRCYLSDCLIHGKLSSSYIENGDATGCVCVGGNADMFNKCSSNTNRVYPIDTEFLKVGSRYYELTDEKATEWLGNDGTQVGIHGGSIPFDPNTSNPRITRFDVSSKTTPDGKLAVDIEVKTN